ncbi:MAG: V-type ATP synthase subunit E family protein [Candidatus Omnitrophota bacterium]|nr:V-type ATP synthase subunit E family protein [Candidatus Omnitrophota bacterium]
MAEELKDLIEKINEEGVKAAQTKAKTIEDQAGQRAKSIIERAEKEALEIVSEAKSKFARLEESTKASLRQAARDLILSLRKEVNAMLDKIVSSHVHKALRGEEMAKLIVSMIKDSAPKGEGCVIVAVKKEDLEKLEKSLLSELKDEAKKAVVLKAADDIRGGFRISYDEGRSCFDFTDQAVAEYIGSYLKPRLADIFKREG